MSMTILTVYQVCLVFVLYSLIAVVLPMVLTERAFPALRLSEKLLLSVVFGNFYIVNEVFLLEYLKISNRATLILGLILPFISVHALLRKKTVGSYVRTGEKRFIRVVLGEDGLKTIAMRIRKKIRVAAERCISFAGKRPVDILMFLAVTAGVLYIYMPNMLTSYGYCASDLPVHNDWINSMEAGELFADGVYPFGFHCVIYFLHEVFGVGTHVVLRVFGLVETLYIHWMLLLFLKAILKSAALAYLCTAGYTLLGLFQSYTYSRYLSALPQEFGMIFILPAVYFGFAYFRTRERKWLFGFAASFGLTFAIHFYDTVIAGMFCAAMAVGFFFKFLRPKYFFPIIGTVILSLTVAAAPMAIAYALGTPLQGSMEWGQKVIEGTAEAETESEIEAYSETETEIKIETETETVTAQETDSAEADTEDKLSSSMTKYVFFEDASLVYPRAVYAGIALCILLSVLCLIFGDFDRMAELMTVSLFQVLMLILQSSEALGLPTLMDGGRSSIYFSYMLPVLWGLGADELIRLPERLFHRKRIRQALALLVSAAAIIAAVEEGFLKAPVYTEAYETNDAAICLNNILSERENETWTVCSTSDELHMTEEYGYHYEMITFLWDIEFAGRHTGVTIPTEYTYFFVEKKPIDYYGSYEGSGQEISAAGALLSLPESTSSGEEYWTKNRWIVMSRMYYWAEAFMELYPENMTVYYETEDFICYQLKQNTQRLFELGIDYGYNYYYG